MNTFILIVIVLSASILQAGTGFGFAIMAVPFLLILYPAHDAIQLNIILSLMITVLMAYKIRNDADRELLKRLILGSFIGVIPGMLIFNFLNVWYLKLLVSIFILIFAALSITKLAVKPSDTKEYITGAFAGMLTASIGMPGAALLVYFAGVEIDKVTLRGTTFAYFLFIYFTTFILQVFTNGIPKYIWIASLWGLPFIVLGIYLGDLLFKRLDQKFFQKIIQGLLFSTGGYLLITTLMG